MTSTPTTDLAQRSPTLSVDPRPLPVDADGTPTAAPCRTCGVAVPLTRATPTEHRDFYRRHVDGRPMDLPYWRQDFARCGHCAGHHAFAAAIVEAHPGLARRLGSIARDRVEAALVALAALDIPAPDLATLSKPEIGRLMRFLAPEGDRIRWINHAEDAPGHAMPCPYAHADVRRLNVAWAALLIDRRATDGPPVPLPPPMLTHHDLPGGAQPVGGGCLLCGVATVAVPSRTVARAGGTAQAAASVWTLSPACSPYQIGGRRSPVTVRGYSCPDCTEALDRLGCVGPSAIEWAVVVMLGLDSHWGDSTTMTRIPAWGALVANALRRVQPAPAPNAEPWAHLGDLSHLRASLAANLGVAP